MESGWNLLLIVGPVAVVALAGIVVASTLAFRQFGWRGWKIPLFAALAGAAALAVVFSALN
jgi:hypothetical protein